MILCNPECYPCCNFCIIEAVDDKLNIEKGEFEECTKFTLEGV